MQGARKAHTPRKCQDFSGYPGGTGTPEGLRVGTMGEAPLSGAHLQGHRLIRSSTSRTQGES